MPFWVLRDFDIHLDNNPIRSRPAEGLRRVHLFRFGRRRDEGSWSRGPRHVAVLVDPCPQVRGKSFGPFVAQVLVLIPAAQPPAPAISVRLFREVGGDGEVGVENLETGGQWVDQSYVDATRGRRHCEFDAHAGTGAYMPYAVLVAAYICWIVDSFIDAFDGEAEVGGVEA